MNRRPPVPPPPVCWGPRPRAVAQPFAPRLVQTMAPGVVVQRMALTVGNVDPVIRKSMGIILVRKENQQQPHANAQLPSLEAQNTTLAHLGGNETLYLDAHTAMPDNQGIPGTALTFGGLTPEELADLLVDKGLAVTYTGKIYLNGCSTTNDTTGEAYASRFQKAMALRQRFVRVKGNAGFSQVQDDGKTRVIPPTQQGAIERTTLHQMVGTYQSLRQEHAALDNELMLPTTTPERVKEIISRLKEIKIEAPQRQFLAEQQHPLTYLGDKQLRPTLEAPQTVTHFEKTAGSYRQIPEPIGSSGRSLLHHVTRAIARYDDLFKITQSAESAAAVAVLRNLQDHTPLFLAVSYYLFPNRPKPPAPTVQVGRKLKPGTSFYKYLLAEFSNWL